MENRPKLEIPLKPLDRTLNNASTFFLILLWAITMFSYWKLPPTIAAHFNAAGEVNGYGSKNILWILPIFGTIIYIGFSILSHYPERFNYLTPITDENAKRQYSLATRLLRLLKLFILVIFSFLILLTYLVTTRLANGLGGLFLPIILFFLLTPMVITIVSSVRKR